ncbi:MAG: fibronectin type III domain-containing protein [Melioribacteraceae bacterium]
MFVEIRKLLFFLIFLSITFLNVNFAQTTRSHEIGPLWETMFSSGSIPSYAPLQNQMTYPGGDFRTMTRKNLEGLGIWIGTKNWTDKQNIFHTTYVSEGGLENDEAFEYIFPISIRKRVRNRLPNVYVNGILEERYLDTRALSSKSSTIIADEVIDSKYSTNVGVSVKMSSYALANHNHNSYIIREYTFTNDGNADATENTIELLNQNLTDVYFGFQYALLPGGDRGHQIVNQNDEWSVYYGNQPGDTLRGLYYVYDGNADDNHADWDDIGDPDPTTGEFLSTQYPGFGVLHADTSPLDKNDDRYQPSTVNIVPRRIMKSYTKGNTENEMYLEMSSGEQSQGTVGKAQTSYDALVQAPILLMSFGPYNLNFGESLTFVLYEAVGSISQKLAVTSGAEWLNGTLSFNGKTGDEAKNALVSTGLDSLLKHANNVEYAWEIGLQNLPTPPPAPDDFKIFSGPGKIELEWGSVADIADWQTGNYDFAGYKIYRTEGSYTNVYQNIATFYGDTTHYTDRNVERGKKYYYAVTAFDDGSQNTTDVNLGESLESSKYYNRNFAVAASPFIGAQPTLDSVYVVPNPYHVQGLTYGGSVVEDYTDVPRLEDKIGFVGLPAKAIIRIFSMHGDLLATIPHPNPDNPNSVAESADEEWFQITDFWQTIKSGVYVYYIEGWDLEGKSIGSTKGKFVIIR